MILRQKGGELRWKRSRQAQEVRKACHLAVAIVSVLRRTHTRGLIEEQTLTLMLTRVAGVVVIVRERAQWADNWSSNRGHYVIMEPLAVRRKQGDPILN